MSHIGLDQNQILYTKCPINKQSNRKSSKEPKQWKLSSQMNKHGAINGQWINKSNEISSHTYCILHMTVNAQQSPPGTTILSYTFHVIKTQYDNIIRHKKYIYWWLESHSEAFEYVGAADRGQEQCNGSNWSNKAPEVEIFLEVKMSLCCT